MKNSVEMTRWLAVGSVLGLIVLGVAWELVLAPIKPGGSLLALKVLPLCYPASRAAEKQNVHLPLGQPDGVAVLYRGRSARLQRQSAQQLLRHAGGTAVLHPVCRLRPACALAFST